MNQKNTAPLFVALAALLWSFNGVLTKYIVWGGITCAVLRGVISFVCMSLVLRRKVWKIKFNRYKLLAAFCFVMQSMLYLVSLKYTTAANASAIQNISPIYIIVLNALFLHKLPRKPDVAACFLMILGVSIAFAGNMAGGGFLGNLLALLSGIFYAGVIFVAKMPQVDDPVEPTLLGNALYIFLIPLCFTDPAFPSFLPTVWLAQFALSLLCGVLAWLAFSKGIRHTSALLANFITMADPVASAILTFLFLNERPTPLSLVGCTIVIVTLLAYFKWQAKNEEEEVPAHEEAGSRAGL